MGDNTELVIKHILKTSVNICGEKNTSVRKLDVCCVKKKKRISEFVPPANEVAGS